MNAPKLTDQQREALDQNHGFVQGDSYILMSDAMFREMMGVGTEEELAASLAAIHAAMAEVQSGRTISLAEAERRLNEKYGVHDSTD